MIGLFHLIRQTRWTRLLVGSVVLSTFLHPCAAQEKSPKDSSTAKVPLPAAAQSSRIAQAIADLGSPNFNKRDRASQELWRAGIAAQSALEAAVANSDDFETICRARQILLSFQLGIYPDTPPQIASQIKMFHLGNFYIKQRVAQELLANGKTDLLRRLIDAETNTRIRDQLSRMFLPQVGSRADGAPSSYASGVLAFAPRDVGLEVREKLAQRDFDAAERLLHDVTEDSTVRDYAALLLARGKLDAAIAQLRANLGRVRHRMSNVTTQRKLALFLRAKGDLSGAIEAAKAAKDDKLVEGLMIENGDWKELAKLDAKADIIALADQPDGANTLARILTFRHLAGDKPAGDEAAAAIVTALKQRQFHDNKLLEALILNDRSDQVIEAAASDYPRIAFEMLSARYRMKDAFQAAKISVPIPAKFDWTAWLKDGQPTATMERRFLAHHMLRALHSVGEEQQAHELNVALVSMIKENLPAREWEFEGLFLVETEAAAAPAEASDDVAAKLLALNAETSVPVVAALYRRQETVTLLLWKALRKQFPADDPATLGRLRRLMALHPDAKSVKELRGLTDHFETELTDGANAVVVHVSGVRAAKLLALATLFHRSGEGKLAVKYLARISSAEATQQTLISQGDLYAEEKRWSEAVKSYETARAKDRRSASALYLLGWAQSQGGQEAEGRKQMELAVMLPLADGASRQELARTLARLHQDDEAARQRQLVLRLAEPHDASILQCLDEIGETAALNKAETGTSAVWQRLAVELLLTRSVFTIENRVYVQWRLAQHRSAARELLRDGKTAAAIDELHLAEAIMPRDVELSIDCDAALRKQGAAAEADALYRRIAGRLEENCRNFPHCGTCPNDLAWLAANLDRDLDKALTNAQKAVELEPKSPGILDTLAEVHFRRGNKAEAVRLAKRCVEMDGELRHFQEQLAF